MANNFQNREKALEFINRIYGNLCRFEKICENIDGKLHLLSKIREIKLEVGDLMNEFEGYSENDLNRSRSCRFRENGLCGKAKSCELCSYMKNVSKLWKEFCDTPLYKSGSIAEEWNNFPIGTLRTNIENWFYNTYEVDIDALKSITGRDYQNVSR